jgi:hypothetical protein
MASNHLFSDYIDSIALQLWGDVYSASGDLTDCEIRQRLMPLIVRRCGFPRDQDMISGVGNDYENRPLLTPWQVSGLVFDMWRYMDRMREDETCRVTRELTQANPYPPDPAVRTR